MRSHSISRAIKVLDGQPIIVDAWYTTIIFNVQNNYSINRSKNINPVIDFIMLDKFVEIVYQEVNK